MNRQSHVPTCLVALVVLVVSLVAAPASAAAQARDGFDPAFGDGGAVITDFALAVGGEARALAVLPDGKILAAGATLNGLGIGDDFALARYTPDGALDASFGANGIVRTAFGAAGAGASAMLVQSDGKIVLAGSAGEQIALARYQPDGALDTGFGAGGRATFAVTSSSYDYRRDRATALAAQGDKLVVVGAAYHQQFGAGGQPASLMAALRLNPDGTLDTSFGEAGMMSMRFEKPIAEANAALIQPDGRLLLAGSVRCHPTYAMCADFALARLLPDGSLDSSFDGDGRATFALHEADDVAHAVALDDAGNIVVAGSAGPDMALLRLWPDGSLYRSFGNGGLVLADFAGGEDVAYQLLIAGDKITVAGSASVVGKHFGLARFAENGALDTSFGDGGRAVILFGAADAEARAISATDGGSRLIVAGKAGAGFGLARLADNGSLDAGFGSGGKVITPFAGNDSADEVHAIAVGAGDSIWAAGVAGGRFALARYTADGAPDPTFGGGRVVGPFGPGSAAQAILLQADGKALVAGYTQGAQSDFAIARYMPDGKPDAGFGTNGKVVVDIDGGRDGAYALSLAAGGKILVVGAHEGALAFVRLDARGNLDASFGTGGRLVADFPAGGRNATVAFQPDGKIVAVAFTQYVVRLARFLPGGALDAAFGSGGIVEFEEGLVPRSAALTLQPDGSIVAAVIWLLYRASYNVSNVHLHRITSAGVHHSASRIDLIRSEKSFTTVSVNVHAQPDGRIVVAGLYPGEISQPSFKVARYFANGALDAAFGPGAVPAALRSRATTANAIAQQAGGGIVVAGVATATAAAGDFLLARFQNPPGFMDVGTNDYFFEPVMYLAARGVISGYADSSFRPYNPTTRGQLAKIVVLAKGFDLVTPGTPAFGDVPPGSPFFPFVETAVARGIIDGYDVAGGREFRPQNDVTRGQLAKIVVGAQGWELLSPATPSFTDVPPGSPFYSFVETALSHGIISGYADGTFKPGNGATRGQVSKIVYLAVTQGAGE